MTFAQFPRIACLEFLYSFLLLSLLSSLFACKEKNTEGTYAAATETAAPVAKSEIRFSPPEAARSEEIVGDQEIAVEEAMNRAGDPLQAGATPQTIINKKQIIKDGSISVRCKDLERSKAKTDQIIKELNAYYETEDLQNNDYSISYSLKIRVPAPQFETLIQRIEQGNDELVSKNIQARDVSEEYMELETRLASKRAYLKRYQDLLSRAVTVKEVLSIEENIRTLQEEIESSQGRLNFLKDQVSYSSLNLNLFREKEYVYKPPIQDKFIERLKKSLSNGWSYTLNGFFWLITTWPIILSVLLFFFLGKRYISYRRKQRKPGN